MQKRTVYAPESKHTKQVEIDGTKAPSVVEPAAHRRALQKYESKQQFVNLVERIVQDKTVILKVKFPGSDEAYPDPTQALFRFVTKFYPYAKGGPIYVDEPINEQEVYRAYERTKVMRKLKIRHLIVEKDSTYEHLLEQLGAQL